MRPPRTAKDDQPGPTGRRHSATGGDAVQSVLIRTPGMTSSRWGPRKPGQIGPVSASAGAGGSAAGSLPDLAPSRFSGVFAAAGTGGSAAGSLPDWATGRFSGVSAAARTGGSAPGSLPDLAMSRSSGGFAPGPDERQHSTREQDGRDHRHAPGSVRETTGGHRPRDEGEAQDWDRQDGE